MYKGNIFTKLALYILYYLTFFSLIFVYLLLECKLTNITGTEYRFLSITKKMQQVSNSSHLGSRFLTSGHIWRTSGWRWICRSRAGRRRRREQRPRSSPQSWRSATASGRSRPCRTWAACRHGSHGGPSGRRRSSRPVRPRRLRQIDLDRGGET